MNFNRLFRSVEPESLPVSVDDVKTHLRITGEDEDNYLFSLIEAATAYIDGPHGIGIALMPQTWEYSLKGLWPSFTIPLYPVQSVDKIEWTDRDGTAQSSTNIRFDKRTNPCHAYHDLRATPHEGSVVVTFTAGFATVPADLRQAILMIVGHLYANAEATSAVKLENVPMAVDTILARYRAG
jgi:uncharacterized phiE125 gp8 family phage protein